MTDQRAGEPLARQSLMDVLRDAEVEADRTWNPANRDHDVKVQFDYVLAYFQPLIDAACAVLNEWDERGDGGCTKAIHDRLRETVDGVSWGQ